MTRDLQLPAIPSIDRLSAGRSLQARTRRLPSVAGFSLFELLAAFAIIAVLASMLMMGLGTVRHRAKQMGCASNQRQLGVSILTHLTEQKRLPSPVAASCWPFGNLSITGYGGPIPTAAGAMYVDGYVDTPRVFYCPEAGQVSEAYWNLQAPSKTAQPIAPSDWWNCYIGYAWWANYQRGDVPGIARNRWSAADTVLTSDLSFQAQSYVVGNHLTPSGACRGGNALYMDGHVQWKEFHDMTYRMNYYMDFYF